MPDPHVRHGEMIRLLLVDYGEVISTPLAEDTITDLAALAGQPRAIFLDRYWRRRPAYDLGQPPAEYWSQVLARDLSRSPQVVDRLTDIDVRAIDDSSWSRHFDQCYYSCRLGAAKPDPRAFQIVLRDLGAKPGEVLFIDDRAENTAAARNLGMCTITFTSASALDRELFLVART